MSRCTQHKEALALFEELVQASATKYGMAHLNTMKILSSKGNSQQALGDFDGGLASLNQVIETMRGRTTVAERRRCRPRSS